MMCGYLSLIIDFFEYRGYHRIGGCFAKMYDVVDHIQWRLTKRNIRRCRDKQRAERGD